MIFLALKKLGLQTPLQQTKLEEEKSYINIAASYHFIILIQCHDMLYFAEMYCFSSVYAVIRERWREMEREREREREAGMVREGGREGGSVCV